MMIEKGQLVRWNDDKGFGFITPKNGEHDIFIHISALRDMSRKPIIGDIIHCQIGFDKNGKTHAINAQIEGVSQALTLIPQEKMPKTDSSLSNVKKSYYKKTTRTINPKKSFNLFPIFMLILMAIFIYQRGSKHNFDEIKTPSVEAQPVKQTERFQCQGKVWCSQMSSYEEALFYLQNCPDTKMDGDGDGNPCEQQF